jgi:hypothetical protein
MDGSIPIKYITPFSNDIHVDDCTCNTTRYIKIYNGMRQVKLFIDTHMLCNSYTNVD